MDFDNIIEFLRDKRNLDFATYSRATLERRCTLFFNKAGYATPNDFLSQAGDDSQELDNLISALLIPVSHFFRNPLVFEYLDDRVFPGFIGKAGENEIIVWSAGCSAGEETYSIAMLVADLLKKTEKPPFVKIYGTDISPGALKRAVGARYCTEDVREVKKRHLDRYFISDGGEFTVCPEIRTMVSFSHHDLLLGGGPPSAVFTGFDIIFCRNVLIYYQPETQGRILSMLTGLLKPGGCLLLGEAEMLPAQLAYRFTELLPGSRIFRLLEGSKDT